MTAASSFGKVLAPADVGNALPSPFALRGELERDAEDTASGRLSRRIDAGQGNPCGFGHRPLRQAFAQLVQLSTEDFRTMPPAALPYDSPELWKAVCFLAELTGQRADDVIVELAEWCFASRYPPQPQPPTVEAVLRRYVHALHLGESATEVDDILITAGASAAAYLTLRALISSEVLGAGDEAAILCPVYSPLIELFDTYNIPVIEVYEELSESHLSDGFRKVLSAPSTRLVVLVNPGNPDARSFSRQWFEELRDQVLQRTDLFIIEDVAYLPFVADPVSCAEVVPERTILLGSLSKIAGLCGVRAGYVATLSGGLASNLLADRPIPERYAPRMTRPESLVHRCWLESGDVAFSHTGSVSIHSMILAALFAGLWCADLDEANAYRASVGTELDERRQALLRGIGLDDDAIHQLPTPRCSYHVWISLREVARHLHGDAFSDWLAERLSAEQVARHLAHTHNAIILPGDGFRAPESLWCRACVGNLATVQDCHDLGTRLAAALSEMRTWQEMGTTLCAHCAA